MLARVEIDAAAVAQKYPETALDLLADRVRLSAKYERSHGPLPAIRVRSKPTTTGHDLSRRLRIVCR